MATPELVAQHLASAFVAGRWEVERLVDRGADALGRRWRWLRPLAIRLIDALGQEARPARHRVLAVLRRDAGFRRACRKHRIALSGLQRQRPQMAPAAGPPAAWPVPPIVTFGELADWLELDPAELDWLADRRGLERSVAPGPLRRYRYRWLSKRRGGSARLIESPKARLKGVQRRILHHILDRIPPHFAAHGFARGRSIASFVAPHVGRAVVLRADLRDFFPSVPRARVAAVFRTAGYPEEVSQVLASLCTNQIPGDVWCTFPQYGDPRDRWRHEALYRRPHLPQGAPTSPALANLCSFRLDCRLAGLARRFGADYTRYADDLLFSGGADLARVIRRFYALVCAVAMDEGFQINLRKTRVMPQAARQAAAGLVLNRHVNLRRDTYDRLKATLHNCRLHGPASQNRAGLSDFRAHLNGRVAFVESIAPARGQKLRAVFEQIDWSACSAS